MSKFGKFLFTSALAGAAAYGAYYYLRKEEVLTPVTDDEESDEFDEDLDGEPTKARSYINLTFNKDKAEDLAKKAVEKAKENIIDSAKKVEEFFNDEISSKSDNNKSNEDEETVAEDMQEVTKEEANEEPIQATKEQEEVKSESIVDEL